MITNIELSGMYYLIHRDNGVLSVVRAALPSASCDPLSPLEELIGEMYEYQERMKARKVKLPAIVAACSLRALDDAYEAADVMDAIRAAGIEVEE